MREKGEMFNLDNGLEESMQIILILFGRIWGGGSLISVRQRICISSKNPTAVRHVSKLSSNMQAISGTHQVCMTAAL